jgi:hypothetical protein
MIQGTEPAPTLFDLGDYSFKPEPKPEPVKKEAKASKPKLAEQKNEQVLAVIDGLEFTGDYVAATNPTTGREYGGAQGEFLSRVAAALNWPMEYAGFHQWKAAGRKVKKGEKAISILMPCQAKKKDDGEDGGIYFKRTVIFNKAQTEAIN